MASKAVLKALERVFAAEVDRRLPFQSKARIYEYLYHLDLIVPMTVTMGGRLPITVHGWQLTMAGRLLYCSSCAEAGEEHELETVAVSNAQFESGE